MKLGAYTACLHDRSLPETLKILRDLGPLAGKALRGCLIDSYEVGHQNWTARFRGEFERRRGYDPLRLLPVITGRFVDGAEVSERFLWDLRRTIADLYADDYYGRFAERCHEAGLLASIEPFPGKEPGPREIVGIVRLVREAGLRAVFAEPQFPPKAAEAIAAECGVSVLTLDPVGGEGVPGRADYFSLMRYNVGVLEEALR